MQPAEYDESTKAAAQLDSTGECLFGMDLNISILNPYHTDHKRVLTWNENFTHL